MTTKSDLPIVWLPPITSDARIFNHVQQALGAGHTHIAGDLPGYADAPMVEAETMTAVAQTVIAHLDGLGITQAVLCGHSIGGMMAMEMAALAPERVAALVLSGTTSRFGSRDGSFQREFLARTLGPLDAGQTMADVAANAPTGVFGPAATEAMKDELSGFCAGIPESAYRNALKAITTFDRADDLAHMTMPTLLIAGTEDANAPIKTMMRMAETLPNATIRTFEGIGHMAPLEIPDAFAAAMSEFLTEV